jgi:LysR family glycine cleavage system transcriptional activator
MEIVAERDLSSLDYSRVDCAIQYAEAGLDLEDGEVLFRSRLFPVCAPSLMQLLPLHSPEDLRRHVLLHDRSIAEWQEYLQSCSVMIDLNVRLGVIFNETALCLDAAARGQGVAIGDDFLAAMHLSEGRLLRPFDFDFLSKNAYYFIAHKTNPRHPAVDALRTWLFESINRLRSEQSAIH